MEIEQKKQGDLSFRLTLYKVMVEESYVYILEGNIAKKWMYEVGDSSGAKVRNQKRISRE